MTTLPVREMVLYKHGVGFFVREGEFNGDGAALTFRQDEINDVLKSLAIFDRAGGQVLGIHYQTPMDRAARLANSSINLSELGSLHDLIRDLRGRQVTTIFEVTPGTQETITGRVIGLNDTRSSSVRFGEVALPPAPVVLILARDGQVRVFPLDTLRAISVQDAQADDDLSYFLDTSMGEDTRRTIQVRLSEGDHQLVVYYVAPSPTWRVSYRVVAESADGSMASGRALLQGWGLFDNRLEEDLQDVKVTLVAGQPISFIYDLYASRIPQRPTVQDESRIAPGPVEYDAAVPDWLAASGSEMNALMSLEEPQELSRGVAFAKRSAPAQASAAPLRMENAAASVQTAAAGRETGETFQYEVTTPVSVKRGESALVPILGAEMNYERELLYSAAKLPDHPVAALRFHNSSGLTLERGPVTIVEDGEYRGEAVLPFTKDGSEIYLPYAVELGIRVTEESQTETAAVGLRLEGAGLITDLYTTHTLTHRIENSTAKPQTITVERPIEPEWTLIDSAPPDAETATERRWRVNLPARGRVEFVVSQRQRHHTRSEIRMLTHKALQDYIQNHWLDDATIERLSEMLAASDRIAQARQRRRVVAAQTEAIYKRQEQLRANIGALQPSGKEADFRDRLLAQLEESQNVVLANDQEERALEDQIAADEAAIERIIAGLAAEHPRQP
jgi:hypothetical protein